MSILRDIATKIADAIRRHIEARRAEEPQTDLVPAPISEDEIVRRMDAAAAAEGYDWRHSIVDLQKTLRLPSDFDYRAELAVEMDIAGYTGTAEQNQLLHKLVMDEVRSQGLPIPQ